MRFLPSLTVILFIWITLHMVRSEEEPDLCLKLVNGYREGAEIKALKEDQQESARLQNKFGSVQQNCPTQDHLKNGFDGFTVTRFGRGPASEPVIFPNTNSILDPDAKTFACIGLDCKEQHDIIFVFIKKGVANASCSGYFIEKWFFMVAVLVIYKLF
ncbi:hypothetical protein B9Z55_017212 [Caenorhabditis nigoni]|uniref:Uncharacterized protein n=1 Tax=Caenorhabditis nigoni TaxID=1611254 RepID=A0A2G5T8I8_9PELO|nr:hypothetical protein B9Z55_017212 [Caenorhabditis nigoni]